MPNVTVNLIGSLKHEGTTKGITFIIGVRLFKPAVMHWLVCSSLQSDTFRQHFAIIREFCYSAVQLARLYHSNVMGRQKT